MTDTVDITTSNRLPELVARIRTEHEATAIAMQRGLEHAMAAGDLLIEAKAQLKHGQWLPWLRDNYAMSELTARRYMRVAKNRKAIEANPKQFEGLNILQVLALLSLACRGRRQLPNPSS